MNQQSFFIKYNGKFLDFDGAYGSQCVDLIKAYCAEVLNLPPITGNAIDYWRDIPGFTRIAKTIFNRPNPGDIIIWSTNYNPLYGHTAIVNWSRWLDFGAFSQNDPVGSPCAFKEYTYRNILGWQRPNAQPKEWKVLYCGQTIPYMVDFEANVSKYTNNLLSVRPRSIPAQIQVSVGMPTSEQCWAFLDTLDTSDVRSVFIFYPGNATSVQHVSSYYPKKNITYVTCPLPSITEVYTHEFLHLFRKFVNSNHLGFIEDVEKYPPDWQFASQYAEFIPLLPKL